MSLRYAAPDQLKEHAMIVQAARDLGLQAGLVVENGEPRVKVNTLDYHKGGATTGRVWVIDTLDEFLFRALHYTKDKDPDAWPSADEPVDEPALRRAVTVHTDAAGNQTTYLGHSGDDSSLMDKQVADRYRALCKGFSDEEILHHDILHLHQQVAYHALDTALGCIDQHLEAWPDNPPDAVREVVEKERDRYTAPPKNTDCAVQPGQLAAFRALLSAAEGVLMEWDENDYDPAAFANIDHKELHQLCERVIIARQALRR